MSDTQKTTADIIADMRGGPIPQHRHDRVLLCHYADRLDAAHKREVEATAAKCCQLGRLAGYGASEIKHQQEPVGDCAKLREALVKIYHEVQSYCIDYGAGESHESLVDRAVNDPPDYTSYRDSILEIDRIVKAALAATEGGTRWQITNCARHWKN